MLEQAEAPTAGRSLRVIHGNTLLWSGTIDEDADVTRGTLCADCCTSEEWRQGKSAPWCAVRGRPGHAAAGVISVGGGRSTSSMIIGTRVFRQPGFVVSCTTPVCDYRTR